MNNEAIKFIDRLYRDLYLSEEVLHHSSSNKTDKYKNIKEYLDMLEDMHKRASMFETRKEILKRMYHDKYVIKRENIPESFYEHQKKIALEQGYGHVTFNNTVKTSLQDTVINDQTKSLDVWLDYFLSDDATVYPFWAKYWAFQGMLKLGTYNKETGTFNKRTKETTTVFADLNREALALSIDMMIKVLNKETIDDKDLELIVKGGSFQRIYTYILSNKLSDNSYIEKRNEGIWIKYDRGSDHMPLVNSLQGYNTGWCTAGEATASAQLSNGDFYVYYTLDSNNEYKVPRIAIRMQGNEIGEIRGVAKNQNLESEMEEVVQEKIKDFPGKDKYYKKVNDMKQLTHLYNTYKDNPELSIDELKFLYEIDERITGFGYQDDPRINEIIDSRNPKKDLARIYDCEMNQIALSNKEINKKTLVYYGDLTMDDTSIDENTIIPKVILGYLYFRRGYVIKNISFPNAREIYLNNVNTIKNVTFPETLKGSLILTVEHINNLKFPKVIDGPLSLSHVTKADNVILPEIVNGYLDLENLEEFDNLVFPKRVEQSIKLKNLKSAKNLVLPEYVGMNLFLNGLSDASGMTFPKYVGGELNLTSLGHADNLILPEVLEGHLEMDNVRTAKGMVLPKKIGGSVFLGALKNGEGLVFPEEINGELDLTNLESLKNVKLPRAVGGTLKLSHLEDYNNIELPEVARNLYLGTYYNTNIPKVNKLILPNTSEDTFIAGIKKADEIIFSNFSGNLEIDSLKSAKKLVLPRLVRGDLAVCHLNEVDELVFPKTIAGELYINIKLLSKLDLKDLKNIVRGKITLIDDHGETIELNSAIEEQLLAIKNNGCEIEDDVLWKMKQ